MSREMHQEAIIPFPPLPFDISREIFEQAVLHNKADHYSLALVSRLVQKWTDSQLFCIVAISSHPHGERFRETLEIPQKSGRFIQALSFVQTLAIEISSFKMSWEMIVLNFPRLVVLYWEGNGESDFVEGNVDPATCNPPSIPTLRRLGGGCGYKTLQGQWECVQRLTHLDLTMVASRK
ncbi:hypothetical protein DL96DRAFT_1828992 [Flagelloscypha sp. PMI_526]|nr:hypothetical protein DL96DRAFT_1828992 [Flagelloscypha sp. PMI_526]